MKNYHLFLAVVALIFSASSTSQNAGALKLDTLIVNGLVYDGTENAPQRLAVGVKDDRIVFVGARDDRELVAEQTLDARGMAVVPGMIDPHTHSLGDLRSAERRANVNYLAQGVTTVLVGNDGGGTAHIDSLAQELSTGGIGTNVAFLVGHGAIRNEVMGRENRAPSEEELEQMKGLVAQAMEAGALGLSSGLYYTPGNYADTDEVIALAEVAAGFGGLYESHLRDESSYSVGFLAALQEALDIGRKANIPVHVAHIKALGVDVWGHSEQAIAMINDVRAKGQKVTADQYPWEASGTHLRNAVMPRWALADSEEHYQNRLRDPELLLEISAAIKENIRRRGGADALLIVTCPDERFVRKTLAEAASTLQLTASDAALTILRQGNSRVISFNMSHEDIDSFMRQSWVMTSSDGNERHPRKYASFPKKYKEYVVGKALMSPQTFFHRSSGLTADTFGLEGRGYLREGHYADIAILDLSQYLPQADYLHWNRLSTGVVHLMVNGQWAIREGSFQNVYVGRPLLKGRVN